ncbi:unnamed protein product [Polarella glacialis]|uniref:Cytochrome c oxidase assembly protein COX11 n=1 Tax=Polarella glacialis TaxID=89957 RepID=A0A813DVK3_POLGL|nr:unnamed protein product [Polarella glacialis]
MASMSRGLLNRCVASSSCRRLECWRHELQSASSSRGLTGRSQLQLPRTLGMQQFASSSRGLTGLSPLQFLRLRPATELVAAVQARSWASSPLRLQPSGWRRRQQEQDSSNMTWWFGAGLMAIFAGVCALVPLYKLYCQATGQGQAQQQGHREYQPPAPGAEQSKRLITIDFAGTVHDALPWEFVPQQRRVIVGLGETALAFYRAKNKSDRPIIGVSVYHMIPAETGLYFNKIQCFCFDEQLINPGEEVDLPIFFFIDPMMGLDNRFDHVDRITLSYLFFESDSELPEEYEVMSFAIRLYSDGLLRLGGIQPSTTVAYPHRCPVAPASHLLPATVRIRNMHYCPLRPVKYGSGIDSRINSIRPYKSDNASLSTEVANTICPQHLRQSVPRAAGLQSAADSGIISVQAVHGRYLSDAPTGVRARIDKLAKRLSGAQAAQSRGSPDSLAAASVEITVRRASYV